VLFRSLSKGGYMNKLNVSLTIVLMVLVATNLALSA